MENGGAEFKKDVELMRRKSLYFVLCFMVIFSLLSSTAVFADNSEIHIYLDGQRIVCNSNPPVIVDGRTLIPVTGRLFEALGFEWSLGMLVGYRANIILTNANYVLTFDLGSYSFTVNGVRHYMDVPAQYTIRWWEFAVPFRQPYEWMSVPLRRPLEAMGYDIMWDGATGTITIVSATV